MTPVTAAFKAALYHRHTWTHVTTIGGVTVERCTCGANRTR